MQLAGRQQQFQRVAAFSSYSGSLTPSLACAADPASAAPAASSSSSEWVASPETCGRGDKKTKRGKRFKGSFGNARPKMKKKIERIKDKLEVPRSTPWPLPFKLI
ncbi:unnamed protein product [Spirodela intermedia]|uniref:Uncharacterized protein n=2 Tax=Spirodela intermedia TaxID=51605 RepID=A0A7I8K4L0_SPIIN|nr:unnamed protein product [Spirodela intermedia]CAA6656373.1 unnamed protein product [Spirodela intermedia]CAA7391943.1 unnamed protein product [Spirodela intermedia]